MGAKELESIARRNLKKGDVKKAIAKFEEAAKAQPDNIVCLDMLSVLYTAREEYGKAFDVYTKLVALCPNDPDYKEGLALMQTLK